MAYKKIILFFSLSFYSCISSKKFTEISDNSIFQEAIQEVYYQKWVAGAKGGGSGINFYITFNKPLEKKYKLEKLHFLSYETVFDKISETEYIARIKTHLNDLILDEYAEKEYGNEVPKLNSLKQDEALLYFYIPSRNKYVVRLAENVKEKAKLAYPAMKPQNNSN